MHDSVYCAKCSLDQGSLEGKFQHVGKDKGFEGELGTTTKGQHPNWDQRVTELLVRESIITNLLISPTNIGPTTTRQRTNANPYSCTTTLVSS